MFPALEPFASGLLGVGEGTEIYWEASGNPKGKPAIYLHGGPGSGLKASYRRQFDPNKFLIVALDQRGCGRSRPLVTDPSYELSTNTTQTMIGDIESLRIHLSVDTWLVNGVSWGTTLALAYGPGSPDAGEFPRAVCCHDNQQGRGRLDHRRNRPDISA